MNRLVEINTNIVEGDFIIALNGDLDASSSVLLDDIIRDGLRRNPLSVCVDCAGLKYISPAGLGVFISNLRSYAAFRCHWCCFRSGTRPECFPTAWA